MIVQILLFLFWDTKQRETLTNNKVELLRSTSMSLFLVILLANLLTDQLQYINFKFLTTLTKTVMSSTRLEICVGALMSSIIVRIDN